MPGCFAYSTRHERRLHMHVDGSRMLIGMILGEDMAATVLCLVGCMGNGLAMRESIAGAVWLPSLGCVVVAALESWGR